jgi:hypothetical protein
MVLRPKVLPPCGYDDDGADKDDSGYIAFYRGVGEKRMAVSNRYIAAFAARASDFKAAQQDILEARTSFISSFPFCFDELEHEPPEVKQKVLEHSMAGWVRLLHTAIPPLIEYRALCPQIRPELLSITDRNDEGIGNSPSIWCDHGMSNTDAPDQQVADRGRYVITQRGVRLPAMLGIGGFVHSNVVRTLRRTSSRRPSL